MVLELKRVSRDFLIAISIFNRQNYKEAVTMEAFKESGAIEYSNKKDFDADGEKKRNLRQIEPKILKNRNRVTGGQMKFDYYPRYHCFKKQ